MPTRDELVEAIAREQALIARLSPGKTEVRIYDYVDPAVPMLARMFENS